MHVHTLFQIAHCSSMADVRHRNHSTVEPRLSGPRSYGHLNQPGSVSYMYFYYVNYIMGLYVAVPCGVCACVKSDKQLVESIHLSLLKGN